MKKGKMLILLAVVTGFFLFCGSITNSAIVPAAVENFTLNDYNKVEHSLTDYKDANAIVIIFIATQCPVSNAYNARMEQLYLEYKDKGVAFLGINSNKTEGIDEIKEHAKEKGLTFTILKDEGNVVADMFDASHTPEAYVLSSNDFKILYNGRIDNSRDESEISSQDLRIALDEILNGKTVGNPETKAFGCSIKRI